MRFFKLITGIAVITLLALLYVHQQVEMVKLSYAIEYKESLLKDVLDRNDGLGYNIGNLESPSRLEQVLLAKRIDITFPAKGQVVNAANPRVRSGRDGRFYTLNTLKKADTWGIFDFFTSRAEAQVR